MKLRYSSTSPFVRKCFATAIEVGVNDRLERIVTDPWDPATDVSADNPVGKIPALVTDDGDTLYDSPVICEYIDSLGTETRLFPPAGRSRWIALRRMALADGLLDATILRRRERMRPSGEQSPSWIERQSRVIDRTLDAMEREAADYDAIDIGLLTTGIALGYLDFRAPEKAWRQGRPVLAAWYATFQDRPSMAATAPPV
jgi:glutathione S-transferase